MKILYPNLIESVSATAVNTNYPIANMLNHIPRKVWQSGTKNAVTIELLFGDTELEITDFFLYFTNIEGIFTTFDDADNEIDTGTLTFLYDTKLYPYRFSWQELSGEPIAKIVLDINATSDNYHYIGIARAGICEEFRNPRYGLQTDLQDRSLIFEMNDKSISFIKRDKARVYQGELRSNQDTGTGDADFTNLIKQISPEPVPVKLVTAYQNLILFGMITASTNHNSYNDINCSFTITEQL